MFCLLRKHCMKRKIINTVSWSVWFNLNQTDSKHRLGDYYLTYPQTVEDEVVSNLKSPDDFIHGPTPILRDNLKNLSRGFTVRDGNYLSARWPGDVYKFATQFLEILNEH